MRISFTVPKDPVGKARPRLGRGGRVYTPKKTTDFENRVGFHFILNAKEEFWPEPAAIDQPLAIRVECVFAVPVSLSKSKRASRQGNPHTQTPDADNLLKAICDGLNGVAYADDKLVAQASIYKRWCVEGEEAHTRVVLTTI